MDSERDREKERGEIDGKRGKEKEENEEKQKRMTEINKEVK